jgi:hypothetical protein
MPSSAMNVLWPWRRPWVVRPGLMGSQQTVGGVLGAALDASPLWRAVGGSWLHRLAGAGVVGVVVDLAGEEPGEERGRPTGTHGSQAGER